MFDPDSSRSLALLHVDQEMEQRIIGLYRHPIVSHPFPPKTLVFGNPRKLSVFEKFDLEGLSEFDVSWLNIDLQEELDDEFKTHGHLDSFLKPSVLAVKGQWNHGERKRHLLY